MKLPQPVPAATPLTRVQRQEIQRWYDQAVKFAAAGGHDEAHRRLCACLERDPCNSLYVGFTLRNLEDWGLPRRHPSWLRQKWWRRQVRAAVQAEDWSLLQRLCLTALERWGGSVQTEALRHFACCCGAFDQLPAALIVLQLAASLESHPDTLSLAAQTLTQMGRFEDALQQWRETLRLDPQHALALEGLHASGKEESLGGIGDEKGADDQGEDGGGGSGSTPASIDDLDPTNVAAMLECAAQRASQSQWTSAQETLKLAMSASPAHPQLQLAWEDLQLDHARDQLEQAQRHGLSEHKQGELQDLLRRLELEIYDARGTRLPHEPKWRILTAKLLLEEKRAEAAQRQLEPLPDPESCPEAYLLYAEALQRQRQFAEALESYQVAAQNSGPHESIGEAARVQGARLAAAMDRSELAERWLAERVVGKTAGPSGQDEPNPG